MVILVKCPHPFINYYGCYRWKSIFLYVDSVFNWEMMIVFVYDTARCSKEEDDPAESVVYFHPSWVSPTQRMALSGQLMGVNQFLSTSFASPCIISLQGGKFVMKRLGQYLLAVGTDRNIQDWIIQRRANTLESLLNFFHCDLETISCLFNNERNKFTEKLYQIFETYLPILQYSASLFSSIPALKFPRSASNVFLEAIHILQNCQETSGIVGGALFYNNKVVASQLGAEITKQLVLTDSYRIKTPAERITTAFHLPVGVQLLHVYVEQKEINEIIQNSNTERSYCYHLASSVKKTMPNKKGLLKINSKDQPILMKRDTSRIFTVPEEEEFESSHYSAPFLSFSTLSTALCNSPTKRKDECKIDYSKHTVPTTPSICSTPLKDVNRVLHGTIVSICNTIEEAGKQLEIAIKPEPRKENTDDIPEIVKEALRYKQLNQFKNVVRNEKFIKYRENKRSLSLSDIKDSTHMHSNCISLKMYKLGQQGVKPIFDANFDSDASRRKTWSKKNFFNTITDPYYPVFRENGHPVSQSLYNQYISSHYEEIDHTPKIFCSSIDPLSTLFKLRNKCVDFTEFDKFSKDCLTKQKSNTILDVKLANKNKQEVCRRSMSLPLKPLNMLDNEGRRKSISEYNNAFEMQPIRKHDGLQLTPLMSKLSLIADEETYGFYSRETTPSDFRESSHLFVAENCTIKNKVDTVYKEGIVSDAEIKELIAARQDKNFLQKTELFLCGHQNMVLVLLMENDTCSNPELIHSLMFESLAFMSTIKKRTFH
ncbi:uncharacterized protein LOC117181547 isoform X2 [Belonocnema kinseyi]|uniref:uncharacterized protein LOC117181547 isoform X2 n=1 Tax=Belonocnema kinseyi TaxID=2817044 RepID=UPI00143D9C5C|nr:uncharacterized protein LOC117181547 isoform X2 [Belonocnema kinseyi]